MTDFYQTLVEHEGSVPHIYLDHLGNPTCGVGFLLRKPTDVLRYSWTDPEAARGDWFKLTTMASSGVSLNRRAATYAALTRARLTDVETPLRDLVRGFDSQLRLRGLPMDHMPAPAWEACIDLAYNVGVGGLLGGFPKLCAHVRAFDFKAAAAESNRPQVSDKRNRWTRTKFEEAAAQHARKNP